MLLNSKLESEALAVFDHDRIASPPCVLVLEHDVRLRNTLTGNFFRHGWQVWSAGHLEEALRASDRQLFDLVITGLLPGHDNPTSSLFALCESTDPTPVIVLAGDARVGDIVLMMRAGAFDVLPGETTFDRLQEAARNALQASTRSGLHRTASSPSHVSSSATSGKTMSDIKRQSLEEALENAAGNRTAAAKTLGISVRTVRNKIKQYGLPPRSYA